MTPHHKDWLRLAEQASRETNPAKLIRLIEELTRVLGEERQRESFSHQRANSLGSAPLHAARHKNASLESVRRGDPVQMIPRGPSFESNLAKITIPQKQ